MEPFLLRLFKQVAPAKFSDSKLAFLRGANSSMKMSGARRILKNILKEQVKCLNEKFDGERNGNSCLQKVMFVLVKL